MKPTSLFLLTILLILTNPLLTNASTCKARQYKDSNGKDRPQIVPRHLIQDNGTEVYEELYNKSFELSKFYNEDVVLLDAKSRKVSIWKKGQESNYTSANEFSEFVQCTVNMVRVKLDKRNDKRVLEERVRKLDEEFIEDAFQNCRKEKITETWNNAIEKIKSIMDAEDDVANKMRGGYIREDLDYGNKNKDQAFLKFTSVIFFLFTLITICVPSGIIMDNFNKYLLDFNGKSKKRKLCMVLSLFIIGVCVFILFVTVSKDVFLPMFPL